MCIRNNSKTKNMTNNQKHHENQLTTKSKLQHFFIIRVQTVLRCQNCLCKHVIAMTVPLALIKDVTLQLMISNYHRITEIP